MTPREQAEQQLKDYQKRISGFWCVSCDIALSAQETGAHSHHWVLAVPKSALLAARRDALLEAAEAAAAAPEFVFASAIVDWLRARAAEQKGNGDA